MVRLRRHIDAFRVKYGLPAIGVRIRRATMAVLDYDSGVACLRRHVRAGPQTLYAIGSITKQFVAAATLEFHRRGWLDLQVPVREVLAEPLVGERITLAHLLSHTSGIVYDVGSGGESSPTLPAVLERVAIDARLPGTHWFYCNTNYYLAGLVLEHVTGAPLSELVQEVVPDDLRASVRFDGVPPRGHRASGHAPTPSGLGTVAPPDGRSFGSGSAYATPDMLVEWVRRLWTGQILAAGSMDLMSRRGLLSDGSETDYGMGCFSTRNGIAELSHDGNTAGFSTQLAYYPDSMLAICVLTNCDRHVAEELEKGLRDIILGSPAASGSQPPSEPASALADLEGWYRLGNRGTKVAISAAGLQLKAPSGRMVQLQRQSGDLFVEQPRTGYEYRFGFSASGRNLQIRRGQKLLAVLPRQE